MNDQLPSDALILRNSGGQVPARGTFSIDYEKELNEEQCRVVLAEDGPMLVIAGAGSGKTRTITYRMAHLIERGVPPAEIMLSTFTKKAAREMLQRAECLVGNPLDRAWAGTFHHIGNLILRKEAIKVGYDSSYTIMDRADQKDLMASCIADLGIDRKNRRFPNADDVVGVVSLSRNTFQTLEDILDWKYPQFEEWKNDINYLFAKYQDKKRSLNLMDYDDLLCYVWELFREDINARRRYAGAFRYILVDEYQDTNRLQAEIVDFLAEVHRNVLVVGDDSQSIYSFRGANFENIMFFPKRYPDCRIFKLETNYRSTPQILHMANQTIARNQRQFEKVLHAVRGDGPKPAVIPLRNVFQQADFVVSQILALREKEGWPLNDIAVLYRAHYQSMEIQLELTRRGIPFEVRSGLRFFEQAHIKDVLSFLKVVANPRDEISWKRILQLYPGVGKASSEKIWEGLAQFSDPLALFQTDRIPGFVPRIAAQSFQSLRLLLVNLESVDFSPSAMIGDVMAKGYEDILISRYPDFQDRKQDIEELANYAVQYTSLNTFLGELALLGEVEAVNNIEEPERNGKVTLSSVHQAKGLEWKAVFVVWLVEGGFPTTRSQDDNLEEERRLFYVASTRAKDALFLLYPIMTGGNRTGSIVRKPSRFITELPELLYRKWFVDLNGKTS
ncbi:MAG TPA: UvrD-helicase domain-containing protein [Atribacteraceae bacterium]|nr:UvrD-helicase domain-containing protein [Atribacteraceae bacterium]